MMARLRTTLALILIFVGIASVSSVANAQDCSDPNGVIGESVYIGTYGAFAGCTPTGWQAFHPPACPDGDGCTLTASSCTLDGQTVDHGTSFTFFNVQTSSNCAAASLSRSCTSGSLGGDPSYQFASCSASGPTGCDAIGDTCIDGSIYAGLSPDGNVPMYTTPADAPTTLPWNNGNSTGRTTTGQTSFITGRANTAALVGIDADSVTAGFQPHQAATYCADLVAFGYDDWYLPALNELNVLYVNRTAIGGFNTTGVLYWSSSEYANGGARSQRFSDGGQSFSNTSNRRFVRCVRR